MGLNEEIWKDIEGYEGLYQISNLGRIYSNISNKILALRKNKRGYSQINLYKDGGRTMFSIHRLVAQTFIPNPENKPQVNHIDEDKTNNRVDNLEWVTSKENNNHGTRLYRSAMKKRRSVVSKHIKSGAVLVHDSQISASIKLSVRRTDINNVLRGRQKTAGGYTFEYAK